MSQQQEPSTGYGQDPSAPQDQSYADDQGQDGAEGGEYQEETYDAGYEEHETYQDENREEEEDGQDDSAGQYGQAHGSSQQQGQKPTGAGAVAGVGQQQAQNRPQQPKPYGNAQKPGQAAQQPGGPKAGQPPRPGQQQPQHQQQQQYPGAKPQPHMNGNGSAMIPRSTKAPITRGSHPSQMQTQSQRGNNMQTGGAAGVQDWTLTNSEGHHAAGDGGPVMGPHGHKVFASHLPHGSHQHGMEAMHAIYQRGWDDSHTKSLGHVATIGFAYFGHWMGFC